MLLSTFTLALSGLIAKLLTDHFNITEIVFLRVFLPAVIMLAFAASLKWQWPSKAAWQTFTIRAVFIVLCQCCFLIALNSLTLVEAVILFSTGPMFIPVIERVLFKTSISWILIPTMTLMFAGVMIQNIQSGAIVWRWSLLLGLGAGIFNACSQISLFSASKIDLPVLIINGWSFAIAALLMVPLLLMSAHDNSSYQSVKLLSSNQNNLVFIVIMMGVASASTQFFRGKAYRIANSNSQLAPLIYANVLFALLFQFLFYDTRLSAAHVMGSSLIVLASIINTVAPHWQDRRYAKKVSALGN
jgi:drug/metabolite transporter (DMT)-like permease